MTWEGSMITDLEALRLKYEDPEMEGSLVAKMRGGYRSPVAEALARSVLEALGG